MPVAHFKLSDAGTYLRKEIKNPSSAVPLWGGGVKSVSAQASKLSAAQKLGLRYEAKTLEYLEHAFPGFLAHLPFSYRDGSSLSSIIPDGVIFDTNSRRLYVVEIKLRHSLHAWFQLNSYREIISKAFPDFEVYRLEIVKNYYPEVPINEKFDIISDLKTWIDLDEKASYAIQIFSGK